MANPLDSIKKLPTWGKVAVAAGGGIVAYLVYRAHANSAATTAATTADTSNIDPQTGYTSGSPADEAALAQLQSGFGVGATSNGVTTTVGTTSGFGDNSAWSQAAQAGLSDIGFDPQTVATALGAWLDGATLTAAQAAIVNAARAEFGNPPVSPPPVVLGSSTGPATTGNTTPAATVSGGHVVSVNNNEAVVGWTGTNAVKYKVVINGPGFNNKTTTTTAKQGTFKGLQAGHDYVVTVTPYGSNGQAGTAGTINLVTK